LKVWREQKPKVLFSTLGIAFAEAGIIWNNAVNPDFIQAERLEGLEGTKTQSAFSHFGDCICRSGIYLEQCS
jgi:hypothetical protein